MKYPLFFLLVFTLNLVPFQNARAWEYKPLEQECLDLSKATGKEYKIVSGEVVSAKVISVGNDCIGCSRNSAIGIFRFIMRPKGENDNENKFYVKTPEEYEYVLSEKGPYMKVNSYYRFLPAAQKCRA